MTVDKADVGSSIDFERSTFEHGGEPWKDPHVLEVLYHEREWSQRDIAEYFDITQPVVSKWMNKLDVETRPPMHKREASISRSIRDDGKVQYHVPNGEGGQDRFYRHQLVVMLAENEDGEWEYEPSEVFEDGTHVHHEAISSIALDVPYNLSVFDDVQHIQFHAGGAAESQIEFVLGEMFDDYDGEPDQDSIHSASIKKRRLSAQRNRNWKKRASDSGMQAD